MKGPFEDVLGQEIVSALSLQDGELTLSEGMIRTLNVRIQNAVDRQPYAVALIALSTRLKYLPGSQQTVRQLRNLTALALETQGLPISPEGIS